MTAKLETRNSKPRRAGSAGGWTNKQKAAAAKCCKAAGIDDDHRKLVLRQFSHAMYDAEGNASDQPSSTSPNLTNADFEQFMAIIERSAGGQLAGYARHYWRRKADDALQRMRHKALRIAKALEDDGRLERNGVGLAGWISKRVTRGDEDQIDRLDYHELRALIVGLSAYARQNGVTCG